MDCMMADFYHPFTPDTYFHKTSIDFSNIAEIGQPAQKGMDRKTDGKHMDGSLKTVKSSEVTEVS